jgi:hypothetical protein
MKLNKKQSRLLSKLRKLEQTLRARDKQLEALKDSKGWPECIECGETLGLPWVMQWPPRPDHIDEVRRAISEMKTGFCRRS